MRILCIGLLVFTAAPLRATAVTDLIDLPIEIVDLLNTVETVAITIDQLIAMMDELDHWRRQAEKLTRTGFRLRDIREFLQKSAVASFHSGAGLLDLAAAIDQGRGVLPAMQRVFPPSDPVRHWQLGNYKLAGDLSERIETVQKGAVLAYSGAAEALTQSGQGRQQFFEAEEVYQRTMALFENPVHGEQEALDLLALNLSQVVHLSLLETQMLTGLLTAQAGAANHRTVLEAEALRDIEQQFSTLTRLEQLTPGVRDALDI